MSAVLAPSDTADEVVTNDPFYAPVASDLVDGLLGQYGAARQKVEQLAEIMAEDVGSVVHYFIEGNCGDDRTQRTLYTDKLFKLDGAMAALNASYWSKALALTDVYDLMPQKRRDEWNEVIREHKAPDFTEEAVRTTLLELLNSRSKFLAERVDGIFRGLSGRHVTNEPQGFGKRMILEYVFDTGPWPTVNWSKAGLINDLRCVIAKFMGRDEPKGGASNQLLNCARKEKTGEWVMADGGALRIRAYKAGTAHLEVHPDMAWRLNCVLAQLHPLAIPAEFRQRPKRRSKEWAPLQRPLPHRVLAVLADARQASKRIEKAYPERYENILNAVQLRYTSSADAEALREAEKVLETIGGVRLHSGCYQFDYPALGVIRELVCTGCVPDKQTHQYYPTPQAMVDRIEELAEVEDHHECLEPSAGQGALVTLMPPQHVTAVEISELHCTILRAKFGEYAQVLKHEFLALASRWVIQGKRFDRVLMNPPFAEGRAKLHVEAAASVTHHGGRIVAVMPASQRGIDFLPSDFSHEWHGPFVNEFAGTSVSVCILVANRK